MSITISDCLKLPSFRDAQIAAGGRGLSRIINHVSVLEFANLSMLQNPQLFQANEILLTSFFSAKDDVDTQCAVIEALNTSGDVGMILYYVGIVLPDLHPRLIEKVDELDFPLIVMPRGRLDLAYHEAINDIMDAIFQDRRQTPYFVNDMLERIAQLPEHMQNIDIVMQMLAEQLKASLLLTDAAGKCLCFAIRPVASKLTPEMVIRFFSCTGTGEIHLEKMFEQTNLNLYRLPLRKPHQTLCLLVADESHTLTQEELESASELIPLFAGIWNYNLDSMNLDSLVPSILDGNLLRAQSIAEMANIPLNAMVQFLVAKPEVFSMALRDRHQLITELVTQCRTISSPWNTPVLVSSYYDRLTILMQKAGNEEENEEHLQQLYEVLSLHTPPLTFFRFSSLTSPDQLFPLFQFYLATLDDARKIYPCKSCFELADLHFSLDCRRLLDQSAAISAGSISAPPAFFSAEDYTTLLLGGEDGDALLATLASYLLDADEDAKKTGELMFLHHNTVRYRLGKVRQRLGFDLARMPESLLLYRAVAVYRLKSEQPEDSSPKTR